jgi:hypothetical protein
MAASTEICPGQTVFQFPLWSDASWKQFANYSSIQFADIDGDGLAELLGAGPNGVEAWHWDPAGQEWYQLAGFGPTLNGPRDYIMTADVDGDGKAELIQGAVAANNSVTLSVFHYDAQPGVWRLLPKLTLTVPAITSIYQPGSFPPAFQTSPATFRFADLLSSGRQNLVYLNTVIGAGGLSVVPVIYSAQPDDSAWAQLNVTYPAVTLQSGVLGSNFQLGNLANGLHQIIYLDGASFVMLEPTGPIAFPVAVRRPIPAAPSSSFVLVDFAGAGVDQVAFVLNSINGQTIYYSQDAASNVVNGTKLQILPIKANLQDEAVLLRSAQTGLGMNANAKDLLGFASGVLTEYGTPAGASGATVVSRTPSVSGLRFEDDASHYSTIQTGRVTTAGGATEYVLIARDAGALHTLVPSPNVCQSNAAGFTTKAFSWFPAFSTKAQTLAYAYISQQVTFGSSSDIRSTYPNLLGDVTGYESSLEALTYTATAKFTQADFTVVKNQLNYELESVANVRQFFTQTQQELDSIYDGEASALPSIFEALNAQPDTAADVAYENVSATAQTVINDFYGVAAGILEFAELPIFDEPAPPVVPGQNTNTSTEATLFYDITSLVGTIISDVQDASSSSAGSGGAGSQQTLGQITQQVGAWKSTAESNNAQAETQLLGNWDLLRTLSQRIASNTEETTPEQAVATVNGAVNGWALSTWQALAPQFWNVVIAPYSIAYGSLLYSCILCSPYQYVVQGAESEPPHDPNPADPNYSWVAWLEVQGAPYHDPVPANAMQQFTGSGINLLDVIARRSGWESMPLDSSIPGFLNLNAIVVPPDPAPAPGSAQLAANLIITGGSPANVYSCNGSQTELGQSTPVNSLYPEPVSIQVQDINGNGIPNATVMLKAPTLVTPTLTITTDANGSATMSLEASGLVGNPAPAMFSVTSPRRDPNAPFCQLAAVPYSLENTPSTQPGNSADLTAQFQIPSRTGTSTSRTWELEWTFRQASDALTGLGKPTLTIKQVGASSCPATLKSVTQPTTTDGAHYQSSAVITFSGTCPATRQYSLGVSTLAVLTLDDGSTYSVPIVNSVNTNP